MPEDRDALVEKVARAMAADDGSPEQWEDWLSPARAAASILPPTTSAGDGELVEQLREQLLETQMRCYKWMDAHDKLKAGRPYSFPAPADLPDALARVKELEEALSKAVKWLAICDDPRCTKDLQAVEAAINHSPTSASPTPRGVGD